MSLPPPLPDPAHLETRLTILAEMLAKAVAEVNNVMAIIQGKNTPPDGVRPLRFDDSGSADVT